MAAVPSESTAGRWGPRQWVLAFLAGSTVIGLLRFGYKYLEDRIADPGEPILPTLIDEMTAAWGGGLLFALAVPIMVRFPLTRESWRRRLPAYIAITLAVSLAHTGLNAVSRSALYPFFGLGAYDYGSMALRIPMELGNDIVFFWLFVGLVHGVFWYRDLKDREVRAARLETALTRAQVASLRERLHPHFLFNTLNAISSEMYRDVEAADRMISRLSDLLRAALDSSREQETPLARELALLETYLEVMRLRYGERLVTRIDVDDDARGALVPVLLLQPLVENAIEHGVAGRAGSGEVIVRARLLERGGRAGADAEAGRGVGAGARAGVGARERIRGGAGRRGSDRGGVDHGGGSRREGGVGREAGSLRETEDARDARKAGDSGDARAEETVVRIEVLDDGAGLTGDQAEALRAGVGLSTTLARLRHLHGDAASLTIENRTPAGVAVTVTLPYRAAPAGSPSIVRGAAPAGGRTGDDRGAPPGPDDNGRSASAECRRTRSTPDRAVDHDA